MSECVYVLISVYTNSLCLFVCVPGYETASFFLCARTFALLLCNMFFIPAMCELSQPREVVLCKSKTCATRQKESGLRNTCA